MKLDIQPLDNKLDIQPLDIQPIEGGLDIQPIEDEKKKKKTSVWEDVEIGLKQLGHSAATASRFVMGGLEGAVGATDRADRMFKTMEDKNAEFEKEIAAYGDQGTTGKVISGVAGLAPILPAAVLGAPLLAVGGGISGMQALENTQRDIQQGGDLGNMGIAKTMLDTGINTALMDVPVGKGFVRGMGYGAGGNVAGQLGTDIAGNLSVDPNSQAAQAYKYDPEKYAIQALTGGVIGGPMGHLTRAEGASTPEPKPVVEPNVGSPEHIVLAQKRLNAIEGQKQSERSKIAQLEDDLQNKQYDSKEAATEGRQQILEEINAREKNVETLDTSIEKLKGYIEGDTPKVFRSNREEVPSSRPPRPEGEWTRPEEVGPPKPADPATAAMFDNGTSPYERVSDEAATEYNALIDERKQLAPKVTDFDNPSPELTRLDEINTRLKELADEGVGDRDGSTSDIAHFQEALDPTLKEDPFNGEHPSQEGEGGPLADDVDPFAGKTPEEIQAMSGEEITLPAKENIPEAAFEDLSKLSREQLTNRLESMDVGDEWIRIADEIAKRDKTPLTLVGGSSWIRSLAKEWVEKLGLSKDNLELHLGLEKTETFDKMGDANVRPDDQMRVRVRGEESLARSLAESKALGEEVSRMTPEQAAKFKEAWTLAHELGHLMLAKLVQNHMWKDSLGLGKIIDDYDAYVIKNRDAARKEGTLFAKPKNADYYLDFPEYFAQRVAREMVMGNSSRHSAISKFVKEIKGLWQEVAKQLGLGKALQKNAVDAFITDLIKQNRNSLEETGQTLFEMAAIRDANTKTTYEAWKYQADMLYAEKKSPERVEARDLEGIQKAMGAIADVKNVLAEQAHLPDIAPEATSSSWGIVNAMKTGWRKGNMHFENAMFGLQQKQQFYRNSPAVKFAGDVIRHTINKTVERHNILLNGSPTYADFAGRVKSGWIPVSRIISGDSVTAVAKKASNADFLAVHDLLEQNYGKKDYGNTLAEDGGHLTPVQKELFTALTKMYRKMYEMAAENAKALGKKNIIPNVKGWFPAVRSKHPYSVNLYLKGANSLTGFKKERSMLTGLDENTSIGEFSDIVHREEFRTKAEADAWLAKWESLSPDRKGEMHAGEGVVENIAAKDDTQFRADFIEAMNNMIEAVRRDPTGDLNALQEKLNKQADWFIARGGTLGSHHQFRTNISGYKGSELFKTREDLGQSFRDANFNSVDDYTRTMQKMEIEEKLNLITGDENLRKSHPNVTQTVESMRDYALSREKPKFEMKALQDSLDAMHTTIYRDLNKGAIGKGIIKISGMKEYPKNSVAQATLGKAGHFFYLYALMGRPAFWVSQGAQSMWAARTMVKDGVGPIDAMVASGKGMANFFHQPKDFMEAVYWVSQNRDTFHPAFISELNQFHILDFLQEGGKGKLVIDILTGEKQSTMADTFSRLTTFSLMFEHFKQKGLKGEELYNKAANATDENMVRYGIQDKPPIFKHLGVVGDLISPLTQFAQSSLGNMLADAKAIAEAPGGREKLRASLPFMTTAFITTLMTGTIGSIFIGEMELMRRGLNLLLDKAGMDYQIPSLIDLALSGDNDFSHRVMSHGLMSAATFAVSEDGFDLSSGNRFNDIFLAILAGEKTWNEMVPVLNFTAGLVADTTTVVGNRLGLMESTDAELRNAKLGITPGWYKGLIDMNLPGNQSSLKRSMVPDKQGNATVPQTTSEIVAQFLGTQTIKTHATKFRLRRLDEEYKRKAPKVQKTKELMYDAMIRGDDAAANRHLEKLATHYKVKPDALLQYFKSEFGRRNIEAEMRLAMGARSGGAGAEKFMNYLDTYQPETFTEGQPQE